MRRILALLLVGSLAFWNFGCEAENDQSTEPGSPPDTQHEPGSPPDEQHQDHAEPGSPAPEPGS